MDGWEKDRKYRESHWDMVLGSLFELEWGLRRGRKGNQSSSTVKRKSHRRFREWESKGDSTRIMSKSSKEWRSGNKDKIIGGQTCYTREHMSCSVRGRRVTSSGGVESRHDEVGVSCGDCRILGHFWTPSGLRPFEVQNEEHREEREERK